jgi:SAM-dependent methyltransferase
MAGAEPIEWGREEPDLALGDRVRFTLEWAGHRLLRPWSTFCVGGRSYRYLWGRRAATWRTERAVEVPVAWEEVRRHSPDRVLEVGNVLAHHRPARHAVVDRYERAPGVINEDVVEFDPGRDFDLIVSISTLEHVGWDEPVRDPARFERAVSRLLDLLAPGGRLLVTLPVGANPHVDRLLDAGQVPFSARHCLRRTGPSRWLEAPWEQVREAAYDHPFPAANGLVIGVADRGLTAGGTGS